MPNLAGKPPISRMYGSTTPKKKKAIQKKNPWSVVDTESVKSAPAEVTQKSAGLSTTVVSSSTVSRFF